MAVRALLVFSTVALAVASSARAGDITRCGQRIADGEVAVLQVDLDCSVLPGSCQADPSIACTGNLDPVCPPILPSAPDARFCGHHMIEIEQGKATLQMNGHRLIGATVPSPLSPIDCHRARCTIVGPGEISGAEHCAIDLAKATIDISDVDIHDNGCGIFSRFPPG